MAPIKSILEGIQFLLKINKTFASSYIYTREKDKQKIKITWWLQANTQHQTHTQFVIPQVKQFPHANINEKGFFLGGGGC